MHGIKALLAALPVLMALGGMALAEEFILTGNLAEIVEVTAPTAPPTLLFSIGSASWQSVGEIRLITNSDSWAVKLNADKAKMSSESVPTDMLTNAMQANTVDSDTADAIDLSAVAQTIKSGDAPSTDSIPLYLKQPITWLDPAHDDYKMTLTITVEA
jgi:hypothetical protein